MFKFSLNGDNSYLFVDGKEVIKFKYQGFKPKHVYLLSLGNISSDFNQADKKSTGLSGHVYHFSVDYDTAAVADILDSHTYLMKKNNII